MMMEEAVSVVKKLTGLLDLFRSTQGKPFTEIPLRNNKSERSKKTLPFTSLPQTQ